MFAYTVHSLSLQTSMETRNYFGRKVSVLFDDGNRIVAGRDETRNGWITKFEDGTENIMIDPSVDKDYKVID